MLGVRRNTSRQPAGLRHAKDETIWQYALSQKAVIVTKDEDFLDRWRRQPGGPAVVWLRIGNSANSALLKWFIPLIPAVVERLQSGDRFIEIR